MSKRILICETLCAGFEHALVNAALIKCATIAFPDHIISFMARADHIDKVRAHLVSRELIMGGIEWLEADMGPWHSFGLPRAKADLTILKQIRSLTAHQSINKILFSSISVEGLALLKIGMRAGWLDFSAAAIIHGALRSLLSNRARKWYEQVKNPRMVLALPFPTKLRLIVPGRPIYEHIQRHEGQIVSHFDSMELPYYWASNEASVREDSNGVTFGYFGVAAKGFESFDRIATQVKKSVPSSSFVMVGFIDDAAKNIELGGFVTGVGREPLSSAEYSQRASTLDYAVWAAANPDDYRYTASASFLDALAFAKPGIYLSNPYLKNYFEKMGDIGYRCDTLSEMAEVIESVANEFPAKRYAQQTQNILLGRKIFEPASVAVELREILGRLP